MDQAQNLRNVIKVKNQSRKLDERVITVTSGKGGVGILLCRSVKWEKKS